MSSFTSFSTPFSGMKSRANRPNSIISTENLQRTLDSERWKGYFQQAQKHFESSSSRTPTVSPLSPLRNLIDVQGTRVFFWDQARNSNVLTNIQDAELDRVTALECDISPIFEVNSISISPEGSSVALIGQKGVSILDVGSDESIPESGRKISRCIAISERFFLNNPKITVIQCEWFPFRETHIVMLTSDNILRFYRISSPSQPSLVVSLHGSGARRSLHSFSAFTLMQSSGKSAAFLESPQKASSTATVYALKSDGNVWTFDVTIGSDRTITSSLRGPLMTHAPFASDMSQMATSILFIDATLPVLLIGSNRQRIIHGVLIEKDDIEVDSEIHSSGIIPSKFEFIEIERLELSTTSSDAGSGNKYSGPTRLLSHPGFPSCYVYATEYQMLGIKLPWLDDLDLLVLDSLDISSIRPSSVQTVLSLDSFEKSSLVGLLGGRLIQTELEGCSVLSVASNGQVTIQKLIQSSATNKDISTDRSRSHFSLNESRDLNRRHKPSNEVPFDEYIESILRRDRSLPAFAFSSPDQFSSEELLRITSQGVQLFQEQYIVKQKQALEEIQNRKAKNELRKRELLEMISGRENSLSALDTQFHQYAVQADDAELNAMETHSRITNLQEEFSTFNPVLSDAERQLEENLVNMETRTSVIEDLIDTVNGKLQYRERFLSDKGSKQRAIADSHALAGENIEAHIKTEMRRLLELKSRVKELTDKLSLS